MENKARWSRKEEGYKRLREEKYEEGGGGEQNE